MADVCSGAVIIFSFLVWVACFCPSSVVQICSICVLAYLAIILPRGQSCLLFSLFFFSCRCKYLLVCFQVPVPCGAVVLALTCGCGIFYSFLIGSIPELCWLTF